MSRIEVAEEFYWDAPGDLVAFTTGRDFPAHMHVPPGIASFAGTEIESAVIAVVMLRDKSGKVVGFGSELEVRLPPDDKGETVDVYFTIVLPGRGTLFLQEFKNAGNNLSGEVHSEISFSPTVGPGTDGKSVILCGTGEFAGVQGSHFQRIHVYQLTPDAPAGQTHKSRSVEVLNMSLPRA
jgi:hypothetical protein